MKRVRPISPSQAERPSRISSWVGSAVVLAHVCVKGSVYRVFKQAEDVGFCRLTRSEWDSG